MSWFSYGVWVRERTQAQAAWSPGEPVPDGQGWEPGLSPTPREGAGAAEGSAGAAAGAAHGDGAGPRVNHSISPTRPQEAGGGHGGGSRLRPGWTWAHGLCEAGGGAGSLRDGMMALRG